MTLYRDDEHECRWCWFLAQWNFACMKLSDISQKAAMCPPTDIRPDCPLPAIPDAEALIRAGEAMAKAHFDSDVQGEPAILYDGSMWDNWRKAVDQYRRRRG